MVENIKTQRLARENEYDHEKVEEEKRRKRKTMATKLTVDMAKLVSRAMAIHYKSSREIKVDCFDAIVGCLDYSSHPRHCHKWACFRHPQSQDIETQNEAVQRFACSRKLRHVLASSGYQIV